MRGANSRPIHGTIALLVPEFEPVIGLEIHAQLLTATKIFCGCSTRVRRAAEHARLPGLPRAAGRAAGPEPRGGRARDRARRWRSAARVHDDVDLRAQELLLSGPAQGLSDLAVRPAARDRRRDRLRRRRPRRDASASPASTWKRTRASRCTKASPTPTASTYLDFNRSGVPLIEIVTEPDLRSAADAAEFFSRLREILVCARRQRRQHGRGQPALRRQRLGAAASAQTTLGTKAEVKNLNSFRFLQQALEYEIERQIDAARRRRPRRAGDAALGSGDAAARVSMRSKEEAHDYRYFPEPDLPPLVVDAAWIERGPRARCRSCRTRGAGASSRSTRCPSTTPAC